MDLRIYFGLCLAWVCPWTASYLKFGLERAIFRFEIHSEAVLE